MLLGDFVIVGMSQSELAQSIAALNTVISWNRCHLCNLSLKRHYFGGMQALHSCAVVRLKFETTAFGHLSEDKTQTCICVYRI